MVWPWLRLWLCQDICQILMRCISISVMGRSLSCKLQNSHLPFLSKICTNSSPPSIHSITIKRWFCPSIEFSYTSLMLTTWWYADDFQCNSISLLELKLSLRIFRAYFCPSEFEKTSFTVPLMPEPKTFFEIVKSSVIGLFLYFKEERCWSKRERIFSGVGNI